MTQTDTFLEQLKEIVGDTRKFIENFLWIRDKQQRLVKFKFNEVQEWYWPRRTPRDIILKFRQGGFSSLILAEFFTKAITTPGTTAGIISYETTSTQMLLEKCDLFYKYLLEKYPQIEWPEMRYDSRNMKAFPSLDSKLYIGTAEAKVFGAGSTITHLHGSEMAKWEMRDIENFLAGFEEAVPKKDNTRLIYECTPQGEGNEFHRKWLAAMSGNSVFTPHFAPWFMFAENSLLEGSQFASPACRGKFAPNADEVLLMGKHSLNLDQIRFRRTMQIERKELFYQEYPEDDTTCFITSGGGVFDKEKLKRMLDRCRPPSIIEDGLSTWELAVPGMNYFLPADVASGAGKDFSYAGVLDDDLTHVASLRGKWKPKEYAHRLDDLGKQYNNALIAVERNTGWGDAVLDELINVIHYPNLYHQRDYQDVNKPLKVGWYTDKHNKPAIISAVRDAIDSLQLRTDDEILIRELLNLRQYVDTNLNAQYKSPPGGNDDGVIWLGIGLKVRELTPLGGTRKPAESYGYSKR